MSAADVRAAARLMVIDGTWPALVPFYDTENYGADLDRGTVNDLAIWCTLDFAAFERQELGIGGDCWREKGVISLQLLTLANQGDAWVRAAWVLLPPLINAWSWPAGFHVTEILSPNQQGESPNGMWSRWDIDIQYVFDDDLG